MKDFSGQSERSQSVEEWLFKLGSSQSDIRLGAILQLQCLLELPGVRDRLEQHLLNETDEDCRIIAREVLGEASTSCSDSDETQTKSEPQNLGVEDFIRSAKPVEILKYFQVFVTKDPPRAYQQLPRLLLHKSLPVRIMAIRTLFKVFPSEALRLLEEMVSHQRESYRIIGISLMFAFPFSDTSPILIRALEKELVPSKIFPFVMELVRNNPDKSFLNKLGELVCLRGREFKYGIPLMKAVSESFILIGVYQGKPSEIIASTLAEAQARLASIIELPDIPELEDATPALQGKTRSIETPEESCPQIPRKFPGLLTTPIQEVSEFPDLPENPKTEDLMAIANYMKGTANIQEKVVNWLIQNLENNQPGVVLLAQDLLAQKAPKSLSPHLPVLCFHENPMVVNQAVRHFRHIDHSRFLRRIQTWISDYKNPHAWTALLAGLSQMKFAHSLPLIMRAIKVIPDKSNIEVLGSLLLLNPEPGVYAELDELRKSSNRNKMDCLTDLVNQYKSHLSLAGHAVSTGKGIDNLFSGDQLTSLLAQIRETHLFESDSRFSEYFKKKILNTKTCIALVSIVFLIWLFNSLFSLPDQTQKRLSLTGLQRLPDRLPLDKASRTGKVLEFLPGHKVWLFQADDGSLFHLSFGILSQKLRASQGMIVNVTRTDQTIRGRPVYAVKNFEFQ